MLCKYFQTTALAQAPFIFEIQAILGLCTLSVRDTCKTQGVPAQMLQGPFSLCHTELSLLFGSPRILY